MRRSVLWRAARMWSEEKLVHRIPVPPAERIGWDGLLWPVIVIVGAAFYGAYCR